MFVVASLAFTKGWTLLFVKAISVVLEFKALHQYLAGTLGILKTRASASFGHFFRFVSQPHTVNILSKLCLLHMCDLADIFSTFQGF